MLPYQPDENKLTNEDNIPDLGAESLHNSYGVEEKFGQNARDSSEQLKEMGRLATSIAGGDLNKSLRKLEQYTQAWANRYKAEEVSETNPIDRRDLSIAFLGLNKVWEQLSPEAQKAAVIVAKTAITNEIIYWVSKKPAKGGYSKHNNFASWSNLTGLAASAILIKDNDPHSQETIETFTTGREDLNIIGFFEHVTQNTYPDGSSLDFHERDAGQYHIFNQLAWERSVKVLRSLSRELPQDVELALQKAREFALPFLQGTSIHPEFVNTKGKHDKERWPKRVGKPYKLEHSGRDLLAELS